MQIAERQIDSTGREQHQQHGLPQYFHDHGQGIAAVPPRKLVWPIQCQAGRRLVLGQTGLWILGGGHGLQHGATLHLTLTP